MRIARDAELTVRTAVAASRWVPSTMLCQMTGDTDPVVAYLAPNSKSSPSPATELTSERLRAITAVPRALAGTRGRQRQLKMACVNRIAPHESTNRS